MPLIFQPLIIQQFIFASFYFQLLALYLSLLALYKVEAMILSSKEVILVNAAENKELFMFDPKTTAVLHKYRDETWIVPSITYYPNSQQLLAPQINKTFVSVWNSDKESPELKISMNEAMTVLQISSNGHYLYGGSLSGNFYIWELPVGILLKKKSVHSSEIRQIIEYNNNHVITVSKNEVKLWSLSTFFIETQNSIALKNFSSVLQIIAASQSRNILALLTHKNITFLQCSLQNQQKQFNVIHKIDYQYVCSLCTSKTSAFVGDNKGNIDIIQLFISEEEKTELTFKLREGTRQLQIMKPKKKRTLTSINKQPITVLAFVETLAYLISGQSSGELTIWSNYEIKKSIHLFKTSINCIKVVPKPKQHKIRQNNKIQPLNKYELSKEQELLCIMPNPINAQQTQFQHLFKTEQPQEETILFSMLETVNQSEKMLKEQVQFLKKERQALIQANLHYFKLLTP